MKWEAYAARMGTENAWRTVICNIDGREVCVWETTMCKEITLRCILFKPAMTPSCASWFQNRKFYLTALATFWLLDSEFLGSMYVVDGIINPLKTKRRPALFKAPVRTAL